MASEDVIELGSSDDEQEPARSSIQASTSKKVKPQLNVMVHIPSKLPGLTIKPTNSKSIPNKFKSAPSKIAPIPVVSNVVHNPYAGKKIKYFPNGQSKATKLIKVMKTPLLAHPKSTVNPMSLMKNINNSQIKIQKVIKNQSDQTARFVNVPILKQPIPQSQKCLKTLPPGITVTRTTEQVKRKRSFVNVVPSQKIFKKPKFDGLSKVGDVLTVELDDDDSNHTSATPAPQWYLKPEDKTVASLEQKNNEEPDTSKFIEITIEDSPIKPLSNKRTCEVEQLDAITIEDSPVKSTIDKHLQSDVHTTAASGSDEDEGGKNKRQNHCPNSKKKLKYAVDNKDLENCDNNTKNLNTQNVDSKLTETIEIELEPIKELNEDKMSKLNEKTNNLGLEKIDSIIDIDESPVKKSEMTREKSPSVIKITQPTLTDSEASCSKFHPIYQNFIDMCFKLENSEDMKKIVEKKIKPYYSQVPKDYTESEEFLEMVSSKIEAMKTGPDKMYLFIKDIVDELNLQRKIVKSQEAQNEKTKALEAAAFYGEEIEQDSKRKRQVRKLEKTLKKLHRAIQKLEDQEVDFDDDGDSVYILTESEDDTIKDLATEKDKPKPIERDRNILLQRYKERLVRVHAKLCQLSNTKMPSEPRVHLEARGGQPTGPASRLEKWINRRVPVGTPLPFPDFHDVLRCVREANQQDNLCWNEADIMEEARDLFTRCGRKLQRRRQENEWRNATSRLTAGSDPAEHSLELKKKLEDNRKISAQKESELINKFADKQKQLKLEAVEIGDKEAEESPIESGDEVLEEGKDEDTSLESAEERKERIKRLLKEKSKSCSQNIVECDDSSQDSHQNNTEKVISSDANEIIGEDINQQKQQSDIDENTVSNTEKSVVIELQSKEVEIEISTEKGKGACIVQKSGSTDSVLCLSDDSKKLDSDVDELHLLQKLHSGTDIASSTLESSDTDTPIAISDTLDSGDDVENKFGPDASDVVSIENSSYSESETTKEHGNEKRCDSEINMDETNESQDDEAICSEDIEMLSENDEPKKQNRNSNEEYSEPVEDILLASSDDDTNQGKQDECNIESSDLQLNCCNLKEDSMSIGETIIQGTSQKDSTDNRANIQLQDSCKDVLPSENDKNTEITQNIKDVQMIDDKEVDSTEKDKNNENFDNIKIIDHVNTNIEPNSKTEVKDNNISVETDKVKLNIEESKNITSNSVTQPILTDSTEVALEISTKVINNECMVNIDVNNTDQNDAKTGSPNADDIQNEINLLLESDSSSCSQTEVKQTAQETIAETI